jgi:hypothetical protein
MVSSKGTRELEKQDTPGRVGRFPGEIFGGWLLKADSLSDER